MKRSFLALILVGVFCFGIVGCSADYKRLYEVEREKNELLMEEKGKWQEERERNDKLLKEKEKLLKENVELKGDKEELEKDVEEKDNELNYYYRNISPYLRLGDELAKEISDTTYASMRGNLIQLYVEIHNFNDEVLYDTLYEYIYNMLDKVYKRIDGKKVIVFVKFMDVNGGTIFEAVLNGYMVSNIMDDNYSHLVKGIFDELAYLIDSGEGVTRNRGG